MKCNKETYVALPIGDTIHVKRRQLDVNTISGQFSNLQNRQNLPKGKRYTENINGTLQKAHELYRSAMSEALRDAI
jgi:hypothetical protein